MNRKRKLRGFPDLYHIVENNKSYNFRIAVSKTTHILCKLVVFAYLKSLDKECSERLQNTKPTVKRSIKNNIRGSNNVLIKMLLTV